MQNKGTTKLSHLEENLRALDFNLSADEWKHLEDAVAAIPVTGVHGLNPRLLARQNKNKKTATLLRQRGMAAFHSPPIYPYASQGNPIPPRPFSTDLRLIGRMKKMMSHFLLFSFCRVFYAKRPFKRARNGTLNTNV